MAWAMLQEAVQKALHYSTPLGYIWMFLLFTFRMFITAVVGSSVYGDESVRLDFQSFPLGFNGNFCRAISSVTQINQAVKTFVSIDFRQFRI